MDSTGVSVSESDLSGECKEFQIYGPPGTGKTTTAKKNIKAAVARYGMDKVLVTSFSKAAAEELCSRDLPVLKHNIGTLHSLCYRRLGSPEIAETHSEEFSQSHPIYALSGKSNGSTLVDPDSEIVGSTEGDALLQEYQLLRSKMIDRSLWGVQVTRFAKHWEDWKKSNEFIDFTDMVEIAYNDYSKAPGDPDVMFVDEAQDLTPLLLATARKWSKNMEWMVLLGDDDQCQPGHSMVLTKENGYIPMVDLDPKRHTLIVWDRSGGYISGQRKGYHFKKTERIFSGNMHIVGTEKGRVFESTDGHHCLARWSDHAYQDDVHVVYLMEKDGKYRIGWCQLMRSDRTSHVGTRFHLAKADRMWILKVVESKKEASAWESILSSRYGIPLVMFHETASDGLYSQDVLDFIFRELGDRAEEARSCLAYHGLSFDYPFLERGKANRNGSKVMKIRSCNLIPKYMSIPVYDDDKLPKWEEVSFNDTKKETTIVYSLEVDKHHNYITNDGVITHNCLYSFLGASPDTFLSQNVPESMKKVLSQSYRIPAKVHRWAETWIKQVEKRQPKEYNPRNEIGSLEWGNFGFQDCDQWLIDAEKHMNKGETVMVLASCSYMLNPIIHMLRDRGIPFFNPYKPQWSAWNPLNSRGVSSAQRLLAFLKPESEIFGSEARNWTNEDAWRWMEIVKVRGNGFCHGAKGIAEEDARNHPHEEFNINMVSSGLDDSFNIFYREGDLEDRLSWFIENLVSSKKKPMEYPLKVMKKRGVEGLTSNPQIIIGTIHSVKGGQADRVYVFPDLSARGYQQWEQKGELHDSIVRQYYVAATRAKKSLVLCAPSTGLNVDLRRGMKRV